ncbi:hypothetical protein A9K55_008624 [Cordyceps militaris]|uniref:Effector 5 n=1 Tax=Cordyceps militaris TaxID=73501 RepID=A0A2H4SJV6_CORMI|nr:hypothetical protein A9K55_008624 [Cordyceps militaris]
MFFKTSTIAAVAALLRAGEALPPARNDSVNGVPAIGKRWLDCNRPVQGLSQDDCQHMSKIGFGSMGKNSDHDNGAIWVGGDGPTTFTFTNRADEGVTVVMWLQTDYKSSFVNVRQPYVTYSLPSPGDAVTVSAAQGISGAFAALHRDTTLRDGHIFNTWGEWSTGPYATVDVSRLPNMDGDRIEIETPGGCRANMDRCVFTCKRASRCGASGEYSLQSCEAHSQAGNPHIGHDHQFVIPVGASERTRNSEADNLSRGNPTGGCGGFENGGHVTVGLF